MLITKTMNNMTQVTEYVYEMYMKKLEALKDQLPAETDTEMYSELPTENEPMAVDANTATVYEIIDKQPPAKKPAKENISSKKAEPKVFKPTPIVNEIAVDEEIEPEEPEAEEVEAPAEVLKEKAVEQEIAEAKE